MGSLEELYKLMKEAESKASKIRKDITDKMQLKRKELPRGATKQIQEKVPKYNVQYGSAKLNHSLNGTVIDPEVLKALDEMVPDKDTPTDPAE